MYKFLNEQNSFDSNYLLQVHQNYYMIAIWILINGLQDITSKNYENNSIKDGKKTKKEISKPLVKK